MTQENTFPPEKFDPVGYWMRSITPGMTDGNPLSGQHRYDVVVIGAGFSGISAAIAMAERGHSVAVIDKSVVGAGASGWNCGQVALDLGLNAPTTVALFGEERTKIYAELLKTAIQNVRVMINRSGEDVDYQENGNLLAAVHGAQRKFVEQTANLFEKFGLPITFLERDGLDALGIPGFVKFALHEQVGGPLNPAKYAYALARIAQSLGVHFFENSPIAQLDKGEVVRVKTASGTIEARMAVVAGNAFAAEFGELKRNYLPYSVSVMVTEPLTAEQRARLDWHGEHGMHTAHKVIENIRFTRDHRLLIGTKKIQYGYGTRHPDPRNPKIFAALVRVLRERFPMLPGLVTV
jgi:gamma-glutamylputrescine oxidase